MTGSQPENFQKQENSNSRLGRQNVGIPRLKREKAGACYREIHQFYL
jgi:hypothetical protein